MAVLTEEQSMLRDSARAWVQDKSPVNAFRKVRDANMPLGYDPAAFAEMAEMGWTGVIIPEAYGGSAFGYLGLVLPSTSVLAMEEQGEIAGSASALMGTIQMVIAAGVMGVVSSFFNGTAMPMVIGFAICAVLAFGITQLTLAKGAGSTLARAVPAE